MEKRRSIGKSLNVADVYWQWICDWYCEKKLFTVFECVFTKMHNSRWYICRHSLHANSVNTVFYHLRFIVVFMGYSKIVIIIFCTISEQKVLSVMQHKIQGGQELKIIPYLLILLPYSSVRQHLEKNPEMYKLRKISEALCRFYWPLILLDLIKGTVDRARSMHGGNKKLIENTLRSSDSIGSYSERNHLRDVDTNRRQRCIDNSLFLFGQILQGGREVGIEKLL